MCKGYHFSSVALWNCVQLSATLWTAAHQVSLSITNSQTLLKLMFIELVIPSNISSSVVPFTSHLQSFPASGSFPTSQFLSIVLGRRSCESTQMTHPRRLWGGRGTSKPIKPDSAWKLRVTRRKGEWWREEVYSIWKPREGSRLMGGASLVHCNGSPGYRFIKLCWRAERLS